ncbi:hypothetical protein FH063_003079 [Azospirillum argentinense]|uniref:Uncharacterized protein n=1 Tax=Azospirillum argentinense TaxID=2970906 RepID=A0A5B0KNN9_9PROT|nr:hypothetical protein FH063_003079 [Azospirillum argentinense]
MLDILTGSEVAHLDVIVFKASYDSAMRDVSDRPGGELA